MSWSGGLRVVTANEVVGDHAVLDMAASNRWRRTGLLPEHVGMEHEVRRIRADEWQRYRQLRLEALKDSPLAFVEQYDESVTKPDEFWQERVSRSSAGPVSAMFVAEVDGELVGKAACFIESEVTDQLSAHVVGVYVTPRLRGHKVAGDLLSAVLDWTREEAKATRVRLFVLEPNERAAAFYRRIGFEFTGETMAYPPDPSYTEREMEHRGAEDSHR